MVVNTAGDLGWRLNELTDTGGLCYPVSCTGSKFARKSE